MMNRNKDRALVLGGGGVVGIAWETGLLAGLASKGVDVLLADLIVGTSAGSAVAAQISTASLEKLYRDQVDGTGSQEPEIDVDIQEVMGQIFGILASEADPVAARKKIGDLALAQDRVPEAERRVIIEARLPSHEWPEQLVQMVAIQAETGEVAVLDKNSGVSIVDAVAASCAIPVVWPCVTIDGKRYYDGGLRSGTNTDVAEGYERVLVVEVMTLPETSDIRDISGTSQIHTIRVDEVSQAAIGENMLDPNARSSSAKAGFEQGVRIADEVRAFWA